MPPAQLLAPGADGVSRCWWCGGDAAYIAYHDREWGVPTADDARLFETVCLEGFQAGLSWLTILRKRESFREAFAGFDVDRVAAYTEGDVERLLADAGIVRHRGKIVSTINNAGRAIALRGEYGSLGAYFWRFEPDPPPAPGGPPEPTSPEAMALSRDLRRRGWSFVGPTTVHAFMQAVGIRNDHVAGCAARQAAEAARRAFGPPT